MKRQAVSTPLQQCRALRYLHQVVRHHKDCPETVVYAAPPPPSHPEAGVNSLVLFTRSSTRSKASPLSAQQKTLRRFLRQVKKEIVGVSGENRPDFDALDALIASSRSGLPNIDQLKSPVHDLRRFVKSLGHEPAEAVVEHPVPIAPATEPLGGNGPLTEAFPHSPLFQLPEHLGRRQSRAELVVIFLEQLAHPTEHLSLLGVSAHALDQSMKDGTFAAFVQRRKEMAPAIEEFTLPAQLETASPPCLADFGETVTTIHFPRPEMSTLHLNHLPALRMVKLYAPLNDDLAAHTSRPAACHVQTIYED